MRCVRARFLLIVPSEIQCQLLPLQSSNIIIATRNTHAFCMRARFLLIVPSEIQYQLLPLQSSDIIIATPMRWARSLLIVALKFNVIGMTKLLLWPVVVNVPQRKLVLYNGQMYTVSISTPSSFST